ncbi:hypothetical protein LCGC14_1268700 [marine sediment metagenome]|uniref:Uncharacterized protein n=1 Tax=marine sediment metagenome TaxID=412755 RepID=A0A0F9NFF6_9ZZZZ|nr:hypothetical protein [Candidatus Scalindua sp.]
MAKHRIVEYRDGNGILVYQPQHRWFWIWWTYLETIDIYCTGRPVEFRSYANAKKMLDYTAKMERSRERHSVRM